ncbi:MAG: hypothetical protein AAF687_11425 [Pseudomonadota bacterium]
MSEENPAVDGGPPNALSHIKPYVVMVAEVSGLLTVFFSLCSALLNTLSLLQFGVNFLEIATPSDLLMSGLRILIFALQEISYSILAAVPLLFLFRIPAVRKFAKYLAGAALGIAALLLVYELIVVLVTGNVSLISGEPYDPESVRLAFLLLLAVPIVYLLQIRRDPTFNYWLMAFFAVLMAEVTWETYWINWVRETEFLVEPQLGDACEEEQLVLWLGTDSVAAICTEPDPFAVVYPREDVTIISTAYFDPALFNSEGSEE